MTALYRIIPCPSCARRWWKRGCRECRGREMVAQALTPAELASLTDRTIHGLYRTQAAAEAVIRGEMR